MYYLKLMFKNSLNYKGRSTRKEYWIPVSIFIGCAVVITLLSAALVWLSLVSYNWAALGTFAILGKFLGGFVQLASYVLLIPITTLAIRRWRDTGIHEQIALFGPLVVLALGVLFSKNAIISTLVFIVQIAFALIPSNHFDSAFNQKVEEKMEQLKEMSGDVVEQAKTGVNKLANKMENITDEKTDHQEEAPVQAKPTEPTQSDEEEYVAPISSDSDDDYVPPISSDSEK